MSRNKNGHSVFPKVQDDAPKCIVIATAQMYSVYCHRGGMKPENIAD